MDNNRLLARFSPGSDDNFQEDASMMESPDSGYRSPQDYILPTATTLPYPCPTGSGNGKCKHCNFLSCLCIATSCVCKLLFQVVFYLIFANENTYLSF